MIYTLKNGKSGIDGITAETLKIISVEIAGPLSFLFNKSIEQGVCPEELKIAIIKPSHKQEQSASEDEEANTQPATGQESIQENRPSESDSDDEPLSRLARCFYDKKRYKWAKDPPNRAVRTGHHHIITRMPESRIAMRKIPFLYGRKS
ncbi:hypothetical protein WA026_019462 [Henosepilachna vigintioctopunctata]|uniref:Uncharacterized protein n=1 Tax=Henosepilachna vigintioctopunctata TaxID=420089 RepID=A0AAW1U224_9CUCU